MKNSTSRNKKDPHNINQKLSSMNNLTFQSGQSYELSSPNNNEMNVFCAIQNMDSRNLLRSQGSLSNKSGNFFNVQIRKKELIQDDDEMAIPEEINENINLHRQTSDFCTATGDGCLTQSQKSIRATISQKDELEKQQSSKIIGNSESEGQSRRESQEPQFVKEDKKELLKKQYLQLKQELQSLKSSSLSTSTTTTNNKKYQNPPITQLQVNLVEYEMQTQQQKVLRKETKRSQSMLKEIQEDTHESTLRMDNQPPGQNYKTTKGNGKMSRNKTKQIESQKSQVSSNKADIYYKSVSNHNNPFSGNFKQKAQQQIQKTITKEKDKQQKQVVQSYNQNKSKVQPYNRKNLQQQNQKVARNDSQARFQHTKSKSVSVCSSHSKQNGRHLMDEEDQRYSKVTKRRIQEDTDELSDQTEEEKQIRIDSPYKVQNMRQKNQNPTHGKKRSITQTYEDQVFNSKKQLYTQQYDDNMHKRNKSSKYEKKGEHSKNKPSIYDTFLPNRSNSVTKHNLFKDDKRAKYKGQKVSYQLSCRDEQERINTQSTPKKERDQSKCSQQHHIRYPQDEQNEKQRKKCKKCAHKKNNQEEDCDSVENHSATRSQKSSKSQGLQALKKCFFIEKDLDVPMMSTETVPDDTSTKQLTPTRLNLELNKILETEKKIKEYKEMITKLQREFYSKKSNINKQGGANVVQKKVFQEDLGQSSSFNNLQTLKKASGGSQQISVFGEICSRNPKNSTFVHVSKSLQQQELESRNIKQTYKENIQTSVQSKINHQQVEIKEVSEDMKDEDDEQHLEEAFDHCEPLVIQNFENHMNPLHVEKTVIPEEDEFTQINGQNEEDQEQAILNFYQEFRREDESVTPTLSSERGQMFASIPRAASSISRGEDKSSNNDYIYPNNPYQMTTNTIVKTQSDLMGTTSMCYGNGSNQNINQFPIVQQSSLQQHEQQIFQYQAFNQQQLQFEVQQYQQEQQMNFQSQYEQEQQQQYQRQQEIINMAMKRPSIGQFMKQNNRNSITPVRNSYAQIYKKQIQQLKQSKGSTYSQSQTNQNLSKYSSQKATSYKPDKCMNSNQVFSQSTHNSNSTANNKAFAHAILNSIPIVNQTSMKTSSSIVDRYLNSNSKKCASTVLSSSPLKSTKNSSINGSGNNGNLFPKSYSSSNESSIQHSTQQQSQAPSTAIKNSIVKSIQGIKCQTIDLTALLSKTRQSTGYQTSQVSTRNQNGFNTTSGCSYKQSQHSSNNSYSNRGGLGIGQETSSIPLTKVNLKKY